MMMIIRTQIFVKPSSYACVLTYIRFTQALFYSGSRPIALTAYCATCALLDILHTACIIADLVVDKHLFTHDCERLLYLQSAANMSSSSEAVSRLAGVDRLWSHEEYSMSDFLARHGQRIPVIICITEGYSGVDDFHSVSVEDVRHHAQTCILKYLSLRVTLRQL